MLSGVPPDFLSIPHREAEAHIALRDLHTRGRVGRRRLLDKSSKIHFLGLFFLLVSCPDFRMYLSYFRNVKRCSSLSGVPPDFLSIPHREAEVHIAPRDLHTRGRVGRRRLFIRSSKIHFLGLFLVYGSFRFFSLKLLFCLLGALCQSARGSFLFVQTSGAGKKYLFPFRCSNRSFFLLQDIDPLTMTRS